VLTVSFKPYLKYAVKPTTTWASENMVVLLLSIFYVMRPKVKMVLILFRPNVTISEVKTKPFIVALLENLMCLRDAKRD